MERPLAAILAADVVGYSRLMGKDETGTLATLRRHRETLIEPKATRHRGRIIKLMGDGALMEFGSVVDALLFAVDVQLQMREHNQAIPEDRALLFRIGINIGDVIVEGDDIYGDGVNVAARLEGLAEPGGICISRNVRDQIRDKLELNLDDLGEVEVKNIARPVRVFRVVLDEQAQKVVSSIEAVQPRRTRPRWPLAAGALVALSLIAVAVGWNSIPIATQDPVLVLPTGPTIAVLPFDNTGGTEDEYFSTGLTEDIISELSRFSNLFVLARYSTSQFTEASADCRTIGRELGADYILQGTVRRSQDDLRVTTVLLDAKDCERLWSEQYDRTMTAANLFAVLDEITERVVASIGSSDAPLWNSKVQRELRAARTDSIAAYDCVLMTYWFYETFAPERHKQARDCLEQAVQLDPDYSLAWSRLAFMYIEEQKYGYNVRPRSLERALEAAEKAIALNPQNQDAFYALAIIRYMTEADFASFHTLSEQAIAMNPNDAWILGEIGTWTAYSGEWERGKALVEKSMLLNPRHQRWLFISYVLDHYLKGEFAEALTNLHKMNLPQNYWVQAILAATYAELGEMARAEQTLKHVLTIRPSFVENPREPFATRRMPRELIEGLMDGLRKAGLDVKPIG